MTQEDIALFNDSLERCTASERFLARFYELFLASSPEVEAKFQRTDMAKQRRMLKASLYFVMLAAKGAAEGSAHLEQIAERHSRRALDVRPELYDLWRESLIQAVRECDVAFRPETEKAWRGMLAHGIEVMRSGY